MPVAIKMSGALEDVIADEDFVGAVNAMNLSASKGMNFLIVDLPDGRHTALNLPNILSIEELEDE